MPTLLQPLVQHCRPPHFFELERSELEGRILVIDVIQRLSLSTEDVLALSLISINIDLAYFFRLLERHAHVLPGIGTGRLASLSRLLYHWRFLAHGGARGPALLRKRFQPLPLGEMFNILTKTSSLGWGLPQPGFRSFASMRLLLLKIRGLGAPFSLSHIVKNIRCNTLVLSSTIAYPPLKLTL